MLLLVCTHAGLAEDSLDSWTWRHPVPPPTISKFAFGGGQFVGVGSYGTIVTSTDGVSWVDRNSGTHQSLTDIAFGNGLFLALASGDINAGVAGAILTSADGVNWIQRPSGGAPDYFQAIAYGDGQFVALSYPGTILSSHDGTNWVRQVTGDSLSAIAYGSGKFVILGYSTNGLVVITFDGVSWVELPPGPELPVNAIVYGDGQFVGVGASGNLVTSADGATWIDRGTRVSFTDIGYANGLFIGSYGGAVNTLVTSTDGVNWTYHTSTAQVLVSGMAYGNGRFVAPGEECVSVEVGSEACQSVIMSSVDGVNWVPVRQSEGLPLLFAIAYGDGQFVAGGDGGTIVTSSDDGVTWVRRDSGSTNAYFTSIAYGNGQFAALREDYHPVYPDYPVGVSPVIVTGNTILTSGDGVTWVQRWSGGLLGGNFDNIAFGNGLFAATWGGTVLTSTDGVNWNQRRQAPVGRGIAYGNGKFVIVGEDGIMTSTNTVDWRQTFSGPFPCADCSLSAIAYGNGRFVVLGSSFTNQTSYEISLVSPDGVSWVMQQSLSPFAYGWPPQAIAYGNGQFVAVGNWDLDLSRGTIQTSRDGLTWSPLQVIAPWEFRGVAFGNGRFVAVGGNGGILQSGPIISLSITPNTSPGLPSLSLEGPTGLNYTIQSSADLISWHDLARITNAPSEIVITNGLPAFSEHQFYRATSH
jgi:hypothetical protein